MSTDEEEKPRRKITSKMMRAEKEENYEEDGGAEEDVSLKPRWMRDTGSPRRGRRLSGRGMGDLNEALGALRRLLLRLAVSPPEEEFEEATAWRTAQSATRWCRRRVQHVGDGAHAWRSAQHPSCRRPQSTCRR